MNALVFACMIFTSPMLQEKTSKETLKEVTFERQPCFGGCPVYKVTISADGKVDYTGTRYVERMGRYTATIWPDNVSKLFSTLQRLKFFEFKTRYELPITDQATQILTVETNDRKRTVSEYGRSGPAELWEAQTLVEGLLYSAKDWKKVED